MRLIDADNLVSICEIMADKTDSPQIWEQLIRMIESVPTIEAEPVKTGKWISREVDHTEHMVADGTQTAKCSVCGKYHTTPYLYFFKSYTYCPNCGAHMEEEHED